MPAFFEKLAADIRAHRSIKDSSLKVYLFNLRKLYEKLGHRDEMKSLKWLEDEDTVLEAISEMAPSSRKTILASIVVALAASGDGYKDELEKYRATMTELAESYNADLKKQEKSPAQEKNWTTLAALRRVMRNYKAELVTRDVFKKPRAAISKRDFDLLQRWIVTCLYVLDDDNPPLRLDYTMRVVSKSEYDDMSEKEKSSDNFLVVQSRNKKVFSLGSYKTDGKYGVVEIPVGRKLNSALNLWLNVNDTGYLLLNAKGERLGANGLSKLINRAFEPTGKKVGASLLRHIYISERFPAQGAEKEEVADKMLHSVDMQTGYAKK